MFVNLVRFIALGACFALTGAQAFAQGYPSKPVTIVVPFTAGSPTDIAARAFADELTKALKAVVVVDNRPGASQTIAASLVWRAPADGHALMFVNVPGVVAPSVQEKLPYRALSDFTPLSDVMSVALMLAISTELPATNLKEFIALAKSKQAELSYGSSGIGSTIHLAAELFNREIGVSTTHVPYKGAQQVVQDLSAGLIQYAFVTVNAMEFVRAGKLKVMGLTSASRDPVYSDAPTLAAEGLPSFQAKAYFLLVGPPGMKPDLVKTINDAANQVLSSATFQTKAKALGGVTVSAPASPGEVGQVLNREVGRWDELVRSARIRLE